MPHSTHAKFSLRWYILLAGLLSLMTFYGRNNAVVSAQVEPPVGQEILDIWQTLDYVQINWEGKEDAVAYHVYRAIELNEWQKVTPEPLPARSFVDLPLSGAHLIRYRVTFLDQQGVEHALTTTAEIVYQPTMMQLQSATEFDRNNLISDVEFLSDTSVTADQVQAFLEKKNSFLATYRLPDNRLASQAVVEESLRNQINPLQILARLQMEQGLVSATAPTQRQLDYALGYGCPDTTACSQEYKGFDRQIVAATLTLRAYIQEIDQNGQTRSGWAPDRSKQTTDPLSVTPANRATAALYTYTPWVGQGGGGRLGIGGNYLFWQVYYIYAQSLDVPTPINTGPPEVVCDDQSACFSKYESSGAWASVSNTSAYTQHTYWTYNTQNSALDWGKWQPHLPQAGMYDVYVWYPQATDSTPATGSATYQVHHADGDTNVLWNQATNPGAWNKIATVSCAAGTVCYVKLTDATSEATGSHRVWLDAVKFVQVEVVCDDQSACFSKYESSGAWASVSNTSAYSQHASWTYNAQNSAVDWGKWQPTLSQAGMYDVYVWYPQATDAPPATGSATYQVHHVNGDTNVSWNQATNPGAWNKIATVSCAAGTACYVKLTDSTSESTDTRRVWLDAVKFVQVPAPPLTYTIAGHITTSSGANLAGVTVTDGTRSTATGSDGSYRLSGVPAGTYTLTPTKSGYTIAPATRSVTVSGDLTGQDFTATPVIPSGSTSVHAVSPSEGSSSQATPVTVSGTGFATAPAPTALLSGATGRVALTAVTPQSATSFTATVPANLAPGSYDLIVTTNGRTVTLPNAFTVLAVGPQVSLVAPTAGLNDRTTDLLVQGLNFADGATVALGNTLLTTTRVNATTLLAVVPAGVTPATYDLTVTNPDASHAQLAAAYTALDATGTLNNDLFSTNDQLWLNPVTPRVNTPVQLGLVLQRSGGKAALEGVTVEFRRDAVTGPLLGTTTVPFLDPRASSESTTPINVTFPSAGTVTIFAIIDPANVVAEGNDTNNVLSRTVVVAAATTDLTVPVVQAISINGGNTTTVATQDVTVGIEAIDPPPNASGVQAVHLIEYVYSQAAQRWVAVAQSGWLPYTQSPERYRWSLLPLPGMRYLQVRARDAATNVSIGNARQLINYEGSSDSLGRGQTRIYRYTVAAGQPFSVNVEVLSGDADLYVWSSRIDQSARVSNQEGSAPEQVIVPASEVVPGVYQVEVYGYSAATYRLSTSNGATPASLQGLGQGGLAASKSVPSGPVVPVASLPDERTGSVPPADLVTTSTVYIPLIKR